MKKRLLSVLAFALAVSAGAAFVLYQLISSKVTVGASTKPVTTRVFVAARDLELGALITERDVKTQEFLEAPSGAVLKKEDIVGRGVTNPIHRDSAFYDGFLAPKGGGAGFAATIPQGMRAFAVHVNDVVGVAGFAVAGMRVDVLVSGSIPGATTDNAGAVTRTLLQNIQVLSAGQNFQKDAEGKPVMVQVVNLLVTPAQAEMLNLATEQSIQLVLRNPADKEIVTTPGATTFNLFSGGTGMPTRREGPRSQNAQVTANPLEASTAGGSLPVSEAGGVIRARRSAPPDAVAEATPALPANTVTVEVYSGGKKEAAVFADPDKRTTAAKR